MESATGIRSAVGWRKVGDVVELMEAAVLLGNGGQRDGMAIIAALARRMAEARKKHPVFAEGKYHALGVIGAEYEELVRAVERETPERVRDEALDVAVTALRLWAGEEICLLWRLGTFLNFFSAAKKYGMHFKSGMTR